jgi:hypothetical protein
MFELLLALYVAGVVVGLLVMRDRWPARVATAVAWPLGVLAFAVVVVILVAASIYLWPVPLLATLAVLGGVWYLL